MSDSIVNKLQKRISELEKELQLSKKSKEQILNQLEFVKKEIVSNILIQKRTEKQITKQEKYLEDLNNAERILLQNNSKNILQQFVNIIGNVSSASRTYIFLNHTSDDGELLMSQKAEFCDVSIKPEIDNPKLQNLKYNEFFIRWYEELQKGNIISGKIKEFPKGEKEFLEAQDIQAILIIPIISEKEFYGFIGFDNCKSEKEWDAFEIKFLHTAANDLAQYIKRQKAEKEIIKLSSLVEQSSQIVMITDINGNIEYVNPVFEKITGYSSEEVMGKHPSIFNSDQQDSINEKELWDTITTGNTWQGVFCNKKKNGSIYYERAIVFPVKNNQDEIVNYASVKQDITNERILEHQLQQAKKMESIGVLAGGVAHDFNNLLTVINGYAEMALIDIDKKNPLFKYLTSIQKAGKSAANLTSQLLAFSRKQIFKVKTVDINLIIASLDKMLRRLIGEDIEVETILKENLPNIKADKTQLEQIFVNLIINARNAFHTVKKKNFQKKIAIETGHLYLDKDYISQHPGSLEGNHIFIAVSDNGSGMNNQTKQRIFEPFFTTKEKGKGTGLGLSTVYGIVKQNKGSVYVYSEPGQGTTFKIYWPITTEMKTTEEIKGRKTLFGSENILIVEDEKEVCRFAAEALTSLGYNVYEANNGRLALELIKMEHPKIDIIISDLIMPELNGKEFVEKVEKIYPDVKVIYVSGYTDSHIVQNGLLEEGVNFVHKPYSLKTLASAVRKVLDQK